jgi:4-amino-4-deoxy-L-arabinose transferase-like glycosyltransferase
MTRRTLLVVLIIAATIPYVVGLGDSSIWDANEAFYVETPREMIEAGDYINPTFNYEPRFNKPVLSYWIVAAFYHVFGVSVAAQRLPMALAAVALIAAAFFLGRAVRSTEAGLWAALVLATSPRMIMFARRIFIDMYVTMFMGLALLFFVLARRHPERRERYLWLLYAAIGLGMLTKGPVALVLPALSFFIWLVVQRRPGEVRGMRPVTGSLLVVAIVAPWYLALYAQHGWAHIVGFFWGENVARYTDAVAPERGLLFYLPVVFGDTLPWSLALIPAAVLAWRAGFRDLRGRLLVLLWIWVVAITGFFTLSATKQDLYLFPIILAVAVLIGDVLAAGDDEAGPMRRWSLAGGGVVLVAAAGLVQLVFGGAGRMYELDGTTVITGLAALGGVAVVALAAAGRAWQAGVAMAVTMIALNWVFIVRTLPSFERYKPVPEMSEVIRARAGEDATVLHYDVALPSMVFYLQRHVEQLYGEPEPMIERLRELEEYYLVIPAEDYETLRTALPGPTCVIDRRPLFDVKLRHLLTREPLPELVLVTNRCEVLSP